MGMLAPPQASEAHLTGTALVVAGLLTEEVDELRQALKSPNAKFQRLLLQMDARQTVVAQEAERCYNDVGIDVAPTPKHA